MAAKRGSKSKDEASKEPDTLSETVSDTASDQETYQTPEGEDAADAAPADDAAAEPAAVEDAEIIETTDPAPDADSPADETAQADEPDPAETAEPVTGEAIVEEVEPLPAATPEPVVVKRGGLSALLGGAAAAVLGFIVAQVVPDGWPVTPDAAVTDALAAADAELSTQASDLTDRIATLEAVDPAAALTPLQDQIAALDAKVTTEFAALSDRVTALEDRPIVDLSTLDNSDAVEAELEKLRGEIAEASAAAQAQIDAARNEATLLEQNALEAAQAAARRAALSRVLAALDSGAPYAEVLTEFSGLSNVEIPVALAAGAESGVPTLSALQADFPPLARDALPAMRRANEGGENTLSNFFQTQFGVRSLEPQEGDGPDAILSRVEAATTDGRLADALSEAATLPEVGQTILAPWVEAAQQRIDAFAAADALTQTVTTN